MYTYRLGNKYLTSTIIVNLINRIIENCIYVILRKILFIK